MSIEDGLSLSGELVVVGSWVGSGLVVFVGVLGLVCGIG